MRIYISGALAGSSDLAKARLLYEDVAVRLKGVGLRPYLPHSQTDPEHQADVSSAEVFTRDLNELLSSDVVLAFLGEPSLGVGAEIALALGRRLPVVGVWPEGTRVSRFVLGLLEASPSARVGSYRSIGEVVDHVVKAVSGSHPLR